MGGLEDHQRALGDEQRKEQAVGIGDRDLGQHPGHVGVALGDDVGGRRPAQVLKVGGEGLGHARGVRAAVVDHRHLTQAELAVGEPGHGQRSVEVVVGRAVEAGVVAGRGVAPQVRGEERRRGRGRQHH